MSYLDYVDIDELADEAGLFSIHSGASLERFGVYELEGDDWTEQINNFAHLIQDRVVELIREQDAEEIPALSLPICEWVGLTDEEIEECKINGGLPHAINWRLSVKVMEAKLKEKNT